ncbi:MAG: hypothetical protein PHT99_09750, partial [Methanoregula sp.]|nr:hypothetical protein [Methanoregula sp.]
LPAGQTGDLSMNPELDITGTREQAQENMALHLEVIAGEIRPVGSTGSGMCRDTLIGAGRSP